MAANDFNNFVEQYFFGTKRPTPNYVGEGDPAGKTSKPKTITVDFTYQKIEGDFFGSKPGDKRTPGEPRIRDINQAFTGNCVYIASLGALFPVPQRPKAKDVNNLGPGVDKNSNFLNDFITSNGIETYNGKDYETWTFRFYNQSNPYYVTVDRQVVTLNNKLYTADRGGEPSETFNLLGNDGQAIWVPIAEKAYAQFREEIEPVDPEKERKSGYTLTGNGDSTQGAMKYITGQNNPTLLRTSKMVATKGLGEDTVMTFDALKSAVDANKIIVMGTNKIKPEKDKNGKDIVKPQPLIETHGYTFTSAYEKIDKNGEKEQRVVVRNPHGVDGGTAKSDNNPKDGFIDLSYEEFNNTNLDVAIFERPTSTKVAQLV